MDLKRYLPVDDRQLQRFENIYERFRLLHEHPDRCRPMIIINAVPANLPSWEERLADPMVMLKTELDTLRPHLEIGDDRVPTVRVQFGTPQVAAAFGCPIYIPPNSLPAAGGHALKQARDIHHTDLPSLDAGWYGKLAEWTLLWKENLPEGIQIQHPDIQSAFNSAHLIRGNDIFTDFYDHPKETETLLDKVTDFMISIITHTKHMISNDPDWFFDWGALWKGFARISNCSADMIGPDFYREYVLPRDIRFFKSIGGGRMHYCGSSKAVIDEFFKVPLITGLDVDVNRHDFFALCDRAPANVVLTPASEFERNSREIKRLLDGGWPKKRNIIITANAANVEEGKNLLNRLRMSIPY